MVASPRWRGRFRLAAGDARPAGHVCSPVSTGLCSLVRSTEPWARPPAARALLRGSCCAASSAARLVICSPSGHLGLRMPDRLRWGWRGALGAGDGGCAALAWCVRLAAGDARPAGHVCPPLPASALWRGRSSPGRGLLRRGHCFVAPAAPPPPRRARSSAHRPVISD